MTKLDYERVRRRERVARPDPLGRDVYWETPKVAPQPCMRCGNEPSFAYRHADQTVLCQVCVEDLGVTVRRSRAALEGEPRPRKRHSEPRPRKRYKPCSRCGKNLTTKGLCGPCRRERSAAPKRTGCPDCGTRLRPGCEGVRGVIVAWTEWCPRCRLTLTYPAPSR